MQVMNKRINITVKIVKVGKWMADKWMANNVSNRPLRPSRVRAYRDEMLAGRWKMTHQGIAIFAFRDGEIWLIDGQHRLKGISDSGVTLWMMVFTYCESDADDGVMQALDQGLGRNAKDILDLDDVLGAARIAPILRAMVKLNRPALVSSKPLLNSAIVDLYGQYGKSAVFAASLNPSGGKPLTSPVLGVFARAHYCGADEGKILAFATACKNMTASNELETGAALLAKHVLLNSGAGGATATDITLRAESALWSYLNDRPIRQLRRRSTANPWQLGALS